jgi:hypothetical protein
MFQKIKSKVVGVCAAGSSLLLSAGVAVAADPPAVTVPDVDTTIMTDAAVAIFAALGIFVAVSFGIRMFKRG